MKSLFIIQDPIYSVLDKSCSSLSKRIYEHSLSQKSIEEQSTITIDYENTYIYIEDLTKFDEYSSLTSITNDDDDDDLIQSFYEQNQTIRSSIDNLSLNSSITLSSLSSSVPLFDQQITKHEQIRTNTDDEDEDDDNEEDIYDIIIDQQKNMLQDQEIRQDNSHDSDELRYSSVTTNEDLPLTCSSLREEALSITKIRCKQRETWFNKNPSFDKMKNVKTPSYDFIRLNSPNPIMKTNESIVSPLSKANNIHDKDGLTSNTKANNIYLIHHQSSLVPKKTLFESNIEFIQMDDKECTLEIIDGVVTLVPKEQDKYDPFDDDEDQDEESEQEEEEEEEEQQNSIEYETSQNYDSPEREKRSSSIESSISTPSISEHEQEREHDHSLSTSNINEQSQEPFVLLRDLPSKSSPLPTQTEQSVDLLDLFSTPPVPLSNSPTHANEEKPNHTKNLLDDSLSSISFEEQNSTSHSESIEKSPSPIVVAQQENLSKHSSPSTSIKEELSSKQIVEPETDYPLPKTEPPPAAKPINKARINEFASLLSSAVHLSQPVNTKPPPIPPSPSNSDIQQLSNSERDSYHTLPSNTNSESEETKKHIDARYNEKIDDRKSIQINSSNIKALFEQKISDANKILAQSTEQLTHIQENKQSYRKAPVSYAYVNKQNTQPIIRRQSFQDSTNMNKYSNQLKETKDILIEDKPPEPTTHQTQQYSTRRNNTEQIVRSNMDSAPVSPVQIANGYYSESLIAREIRETKEKEEALRQQRKKCGLPEDVSALLPPRPHQDTNKSEQSLKPPVKSSSFLSNLDFFTSKSSESTSPRRSTVSIQNLVYDSSQNSSFNDERRTFATQEQQQPFLSAQRTNSIQRTSSNQNLLSPQTKSNIIQREIEAIRAKESELRESGRIQHTSDEHSDPRKYQEFVSPIAKSQSATVLSTGKIRKETERLNVPILPNSNGMLKPKTVNNNYSTNTISSLRGRFPSPNPSAPIVAASNKAIDYSKLTSAERLELEKREIQERELELKKQRHSVSGNISAGNSTINGDSGNVSQDEDEHENYLDKIQRLKRTENEKAQVPLQRPVKKSNLSQKWEQMVANKTNNSNFSDDHN